MDSKSEMSAKEFLQQLRSLDCDITIKINEINRINEIIAPLGIPQTERVNTSGTSDKTAELATQLKMLQDEATEKCTEWAKMKIEALKVINQMKDKRHQRILNLYYIQNKTLTKTAAIMHISYQWASLIRTDAEAEFERLMNEMGLCGVTSEEHISHDTH